MGKLFGTDGIRGTTEYNNGVDRGLRLTPELALRIGHAAGVLVHTSLSPDGERNSVIIGRDTRVSGLMLETAMAAGLMAQGIDVIQIGVIPTPAVALFTKQMGAQLGIAISASHNPVVDNGIKFFDPEGYKLDGASEELIQTLVLDPDLVFTPRSTRQLGRLKSDEKKQQAYIDYLVHSWRGTKDLSGRLVFLECTNGATSHIAPEVFRRLGANVKVINGDPDGLNINESYEYVDAKRFGQRIVEAGADFGAAFDGDGDRVVLVDEQGNTIDGDVILAILARRLFEQKGLPGHTVVATNMSNYGLHDSLREIGVGVIETNVGDKYVLQQMLADGYALGGERSGHILILDQGQTTGDGIYTALTVAAALVDQDGAQLSKMATVMPRYPQFIESAAVPSAKPPLCEIKAVQEIVSQLQDQLGAQAEIGLRYSGTEDKIRLSVRSKGDGNADLIATKAGGALQQIAQSIYAFDTALTAG